MRVMLEVNGNGGTHRSSVRCGRGRRGEGKCAHRGAHLLERGAGGDQRPRLLRFPALRLLRASTPLTHRAATLLARLLRSPRRRLLRAVVQQRKRRDELSRARPAQLCRVPAQRLDFLLVGKEFLNVNI